MTDAGPLHAALANVRLTNAAHVSALDAMENAFVAETALSLRLSFSSSNDQKGIEDKDIVGLKKSHKPLPIETSWMSL